MSLILGLSTALPGTVTPTDEYICHAKSFSCSSSKQEKVLEQLYRRTEIRSRCSALTSAVYGSSGDKVFAPPTSVEDRGPSTNARMRVYAEEVKPLAGAAARGAIADAGIAPSEITHLVTVSCTGFDAPGFDIDLIEQLSLPRSTTRTHVGFMGCHGAMNALKVASAFASSQPKSRVLVCAAELCSLHFQYGWSPDNLVANSLFSDGAGAFVMADDDAQGVWRHISSTSFVVPDSRDAMKWQIRDHGFGMHLESSVPDIVSQWLPDLIQSWLADLSIDQTQIAGWAVHPGGPRILDAVGGCLNLPVDALGVSRSILAEFGNMSSPTVLFILDRMRSMGMSGYVVLLGFGPGLTVEAALLEAFPHTSK